MMNSTISDQNVPENLLSFRTFQIDDFSQCAKFTSQEWVITSILKNSKDEEKLIRAYLELARLSSSYLEVACISDQVVGLLFGNIKKDWSLYNKVFNVLHSLITIIKALFGQYGSLSEPLLFLNSLIMTEIKSQRNSPETDSEIVLFIVDRQHRGKGIGRTLMDRFVSVVKHKQVQKICLYTDPFSHWKFYEKYGFKFYSAFENDLDSFLRKKTVQGFVYLWETKKE